MPSASCRHDRAGVEALQELRSLSRLRGSSSRRWIWRCSASPAARPGTAQRYRRLRYGRGSQHDWRLNTSASTIRTRFGPAISIPTTDGAELEGANSFPIVFFNNESYTIALLLKGRSGGASTKHLYRSGVSSTDDHILWLARGVTPNLRATTATRAR